MPTPAVDVDRVSRLIDDVAREVVLPRFRTLRADQVHRKPSPEDADDLVTIVDREAEDLLSRELIRLVPGSRVVGEESAHASPDLLRLVHEDAPVWVVDPLDGTKNFAHGHDAFGIMIGLAVAGEMRAGWVHLPALDLRFTAEAGNGAFCNGERLRVPAVPSPEPPRGTFFLRYMPERIRHDVSVRSAGHFTPAHEEGCAAVEYADVLRGRKEFVVYYRLYPWDHGGPALILREGGGAVEHLDGTPYTVRSSHQVTLVARDRTMADRLRGWLA
jgi:fructose-1,6-bisphosphatase/inositol monophosphatase family enzyme